MNERIRNIILMGVFFILIFLSTIGLLTLLFDDSFMRVKVIEVSEKQSDTEWKWVNLYWQYKPDNFSTGVYFVEDEVYCVKVGDRSVEDIIQTDYHEMSHHLVNQLSEHYCRGKLG